MDSIREITHPMMQLTTAELLRLRLYALWRIEGLGPKASGRVWADLLKEAMAATASGERPWETGIDLCSHLIHTMRAISSDWNAFAVGEYLEPELTDEDENGRFEDPSAPDSEKVLETKRIMEQIKLLCSDATEFQIVELLAQGLTPMEIQDQIPISQRRYRGAIRQIRLKLQAEFAAELLQSSNKSFARVVPNSLMDASHHVFHGDE